MNWIMGLLATDRQPGDPGGCNPILWLLIAAVITVCCVCGGVITDPNSDVDWGRLQSEFQ
ncbi:hypothetical protein B0I28_104337 [Glycomyces artemisiae]|uniref:Uncharacterized protein n=1 Tax=Glycomyces artemisiae TaxID=1076443 RepID=A0A2T0UMT1_9ACTN|nr:hypothetical protein B0I28_104337 [Glycomyces artemisiae]